MIELFNQIIYTFGSASGLKATISYEHKRDGADMLYRFYYKIDLVNRNTGEHNPYGTYQNPIKATFTLNGNNVWEKTTQGNQGWVYEFTSDWFSVDKTSGTTPFSFTIKDTINSGWCNYSSGTYYLEVDPAGSEITSVPNFNIGTSFNVKLKQYTSFYDVLTIKIGSTIIKTINNATSTQEIVFTSNELDAIYGLTVNASYSDFTFELKSYIDSNKNTQVGDTDIASSRGYIINSEPTITSKLGTATNTQDLTGSPSKIIKYESIVTITVNFTLKNKATIGSVIINGTGATISGNTATATFNYPSNNVFDIKVIDSRGFPAQTTLTLEMVDYIQLTLKQDIKRNQPTDEKVKIKYEGYYFDDSFGTTNNSLTVKYRSRCKTDNKSFKDDGSDWIDLTPTIENNSYSGELVVDGYDYQKEYEFEINSEDKLNVRTIIDIPISKGKPIFDWDENNFNVNGEIKKNGNPIFQSINWSETYDFNTLTKSGVYYAGVNCANAPAVYCKVLVMGSTDTNYGDVTQLAISIATPNIYIRTRNNTNWSSWKLMVHEENIFPVGSIYMSVNNANPSNSFGGTWVLWGQGRVPIGVDTSQSEFNSVEKTGGEKISTQINTGGSSYGFTTSSQSGYNDRTLVGSSSYGSTHDEKSADISLLQPYITCYMWKRVS